MNAPYKTEIIEQNGERYRVDYFYDEMMWAPWDEHDGHGIVSGWETRNKRPGELLLNQDRQDKRFYDLQASMKKAIAEGWDAYPYDGGTARQKAARAVKQDYEHLRAWCRNEWHWCGIEITDLYNDEKVSLWGIESENSDFPSIIQDLIGDIEYQNNHRPTACTA